MNILLLGGTGAMGSELVPILSKIPETNVYITSRKKYKHNDGNIIYIQGNAHSDIFMHQVLDKIKYDCIIDFMVYNTDDFKRRLSYILPNTKRYVFISSARVYADAENDITESSDRLLDVSKDQVFLNSDEYALAKAREEDLLIKSGYNNWIIVRPYITYNKNRLQLCNFEKEQWLIRALKGKKVVLGKDILDKVTSLTYAYDVSLAISKLILNFDVNGEIFHIVSDTSNTWKEVAEIYQKCFMTKFKKKIVFEYVDHSDLFSWKDEDKYVVSYDRLFNRKFDSSKLRSVIGDFEFMKVEEGLSKCFDEYCNPNNIDLNSKINWSLEGYFDKITGERESYKNFTSKKDMFVYLCYRYLPFKFSACLRNVFKYIKK